MSVQPFIINYSGALLRIYPAPWQCMLQQDDKSYACVAEAEDRYTLQQFKEELLIALGLDEEEGSFLEVARRGFFKGTWWEVDTEEEVSSKWRRWGGCPGGPPPPPLAITPSPGCGSGCPAPMMY